MTFLAAIVPYAVGFLVGAALLLTALVLGAGLVTMTLDNEFKAKYSTLLMRWRVIVQGIAIGFLVVATLLLNVD
jgi:hypothetical protein